MAPRRSAAQLDLLGQADALEAFLSQRQQAGQAARARSTWLAHQQALEEEAADCEAQLWASCAGSPAAAAVLRSGVEPGQPGGALDSGLWAALKDADGCVGEAAALAAAVAGLLARPALASPYKLTSMQEQLQKVEACLKAALGAVESAVGDLRPAGGGRGMAQGAHKGTAAGCNPDKSSGSTCNTHSATLAQRVQSLLLQHPLADASCQAQLLEHAAEVEGRQAAQCQQRRAALRAFQASVREKHRMEQLPAAPTATGAAGSSREGSCDGAGGWLEAVVGEDGQAEEGAAPLLLPEVASATPDGWTADEQAVFLHARRTCMAVSGSGEAAMVRQLAALLPARAQAQISGHERWYKEAARLQAAVAHGEAGWRREQAAFLAAASALLSEAEARTLAAAEAALSQLDAAAACLRSAGGVEQEQALRAEQAGADNLAQAVAAAEAAARKFEQWQAREDYRGRLHQLLSLHRHRQEEQAAAARAAEQAAAEAALQDKARAAAANRQRVQFRQQRGAAKQAAREQGEAARRAERERRQAALDALRRQVAPAVERDAQRAIAHTQSSSACANKPSHSLFLGAVVAGFSSDTILQDQRVRVYEALRQLGLHTTAAGRQAVASAKAPQPVRPDILSSDQRQQLLRG